MTMKKNSSRILGILSILLVTLVSACSTQRVGTEIINPTATTNLAQETQIEPTEIIYPTPTATPTQAPQTYADPFAYCAAVGTIDTPDDQYTGPQISEKIINGYIAAAGLDKNTADLDIMQKTTIWRCMNSEVVVCNFGANLPCSTKANTDKTPTSAMEDYCKENPDAPLIPLSVTGHTTIYSWNCVQDTPELLEQIENVDSAGYLAQIWYPISPNPIDIVESTATPVLPGGSNQILFSSNRGGVYDDLYLQDLTNSKVTRLTQGDSNTFPGPFSPDGNQILFTGYGFVTSYVGKMNTDGTDPIDMTGNEVDEGFATWSPDGKTIAFTSRRDGNNEIYIMNSDGTEQRRLTNNPKDDFAPSFSPDGSQIAFVSDRNNRDGYNNLFVMNVDGSNVRRLINGSEIDYSPAWSPDGAWIAFRAHHGGPADIYLIKPDGTGLVNLTNDPADDWAPSWSPDGTLLAFQTNRDGNWEIYFMNTDGSNPQNMTNNPADDQMPFWNPSIK
jgi:Tol biopolymer transport system component